MKLKNILILIMMFVLSTARSFEVGHEVSNLKFKDQHGHEIAVKPTTKWILFASDKPSSKLMTEYLGKSPEVLEKQAVLFVSDISKMPSLITSMVALPKMKKYNYRIALDQEGESTKSWPRQAGQVTAFQIENLRVTRINYFKNPDDIQNFFKPSSNSDPASIPGKE